MSIYLLPKSVVNILDKQRRSLFWQGGGTKKKYHLVKWSVICLSKQKGGLGVKDIFKMNISLLSKWWWKLEKEDGLWQTLVKKKYLQKDTIRSVKNKLDDSPIWTNLLKVKHVYLRGRKILTKNGKNSLFWEDSWLKEQPLCINHPVLYDLCDEKGITVYEVLRRNGEFNFSRWLPPFLFDEWLTVVDNVFSYNFENQDDITLWKWNSKKKFTTKSVYEHLSTVGNT